MMLGCHPSRGKRDKGDKGESGNGWHYGNGAPSATLGKNGDLYLNFENYDIYVKEGGQWSVRGNIKGEKRDPAEGGSGSESEGTTAELQIHFLELGSKYTGDCIYIKIGDTDILVDGGCREASADTIERYVDALCTDNTLEYVIVTHADQDHIAAFAGNGTYASLFERFVCEKIIDFPKTGKTTDVYNRYVSSRNKEVEVGAVHYTALECYNNINGAQQSYELSEGVTLNFLYNYYYEHSTSDENNYSVCFYINQGDYNYLFTGDLEESGEAFLVQNNDLPHCKLYKAGHHGSKTSSTEALLSVIQPEYVCVCCVAGSPEYTVTNENMFPTQLMIDRVAKYTKNIFVTSLVVDPVEGQKKWGGITSMNGNVTVCSNGVDFTVTGSNNSTILKDTDWFKQNRTWPSYGVQ